MPNGRAVNMGDLRVFGNLTPHQTWMEQAGLHICTGKEDALNVLICTYDNESEDPLERLTGTIVPMRDAMTYVQQNDVERVVLISDGAGYAGPRKVANVAKSATFNDVHGMGSLTSEVLANIAIKEGVEVLIVRGDPLTEESTRRTVIDALKGN